MKFVLGNGKIMTEIIRKNPDETAQWMMSREQSTLLQEGEKMKMNP